MNPKNPWQSYRQVATRTASPGQLVLMLYDGIIRFLDQANAGFQLDDPVEFNTTINNNILRAQDIIRELDYSLNAEQGGDLAIELHRLYDYFDRVLLEANLRKDPKGINEVIQRTTVLRDAWAAMLSQQGLSTDTQSLQVGLAAA
jgi:flagellar secretion chaperone FliS